MQEQDIDSLGADERQVLDRSFQASLSEKRTRNVMLSTLMTASGLALFSIYGFGVFAITAMSFVIVVVSAVEKISYAREILVYKSLVRKLVNRLEGLQSIDLTPLEGHPAARASRRAENERAA
jgi:hypothetical protein